MSHEAPTMNAELNRAPRIAVETLAESVERLKATSTLTLVDPTSGPDFQYDNFARSETGGRWSMVWSQPEGSRPLDPADPTDQMLFDEGKQIIAEDNILLDSLVKRSRWWDTTYKNLSEKVAEGVKERIVVTDGERSLELFNCHDSELTEKEVQAFERGMEAVVRLSQGKAMSRIKGIVVLPGEDFPPGSAGAFGSSTRIMAVNLDVMRHDQDYLDQNPQASTRYDRFFKGDKPSQIEIILAHELGHAMDVHTIAEADHHGIDRASATNQAGLEVQGISTFQADFGWKLAHVERGDFKDTNTWKLDDATAAESGELPMTNYAASAPLEDFAETFAIMALGGDVTSAPERARAVLQTIAAAEGESSEQPLSVEHFDAATNPPIQAKLKPNYTAAAYTR